jgi:hypothetical protein
MPSAGQTRLQELLDKLKWTLKVITVFLFHFLEIEAFD